MDLLKDADRIRVSVYIIQRRCHRKSVNSKRQTEQLATPTMKIFVALAVLAVAAAEPPRYRQQQRQYYFARQQEDTAAVDAPYAPSDWRPTGPAFDLPQRESQAPRREYGAPVIPIAPQQQYGPSAAPARKQFAVPAVPRRQYGVPATPQQQYGTPSASQQQYGAPAKPQSQYGTPAEPQSQYGAPAKPQSQYGEPAEPQSQYGTPQEATTTEVSDTTEEEDVTTVSSVTESESEPVNSVNELEDEEVDEQQSQQSGEYYIALPDGRLQRVRYVSRQDAEAMKYFAKIRAENVEPLRGPIYAYAPLEKLQILPGELRVSVGPVAPIAPIAAAPVESKPQKLEIKPVATQVQYQYDNPAGVIPLSANPVSSSYTTYTTNYQVPASESRFLLSVQ